MAGSPATTWALTLATVAPVTLSDGVVSSKSTTGRLKATTTCGLSPAPVWNSEVWALAGNSAVSGTGCGARTSAGATVALMRRSRSLAGNSLKRTPSFS